MFLLFLLIFFYLRSLLLIPSMKRQSKHLRQGKQLLSTAKKNSAFFSTQPSKHNNVIFNSNPEIQISQHNQQQHTHHNHQQLLHHDQLPNTTTTTPPPTSCTSEAWKTIDSREGPFSTAWRPSTSSRAWCSWPACIEVFLLSYERWSTVTETVSERFSISGSVCLGLS